MRRLPLPLILACLLVPGIPCSAQQTGQTTPSTTQPVTLPTTSIPNKPEDKPHDYSKEGFVIEQIRTRHRFENDGTGRKEVTARIRVQSEAGVQRWGQLVWSYNSASERMEISYVRVQKAEGTVVTASPDSVQDLTAPVTVQAPVYTDARQKHVSVSGLRPGDMLEYQVVTTIQTPLAPGQFWLDYDFYKAGVVLDEQLEVDLPGNRQMKVKAKPGSDPIITEANGRKIYRWSASHLETESEERDKDKDKEKDKKKKKHSEEDEHAAVQITTFASWEELGRWYASLEKDRRLPTPEIKAKATELTKGLNTDLDKTQALYDYVAKNFRYVSLSLGQGRYQPHAAAEVLKNQYGDCKDKHTLLAALLEAEGLHASSVLINIYRKIDPEVPSPAQFDHVITLLQLGSDEIWMDTTTEVAPFRLLAFPLRKRQGLVVPVNGTPHLQETPADPPARDFENVRVEGKFDDSGTLNAKITYEDRGDFELLFRMSFRGVPSAKWPQLADAMSAAEGLGKDTKDLKVTDPAATREPFALSYNVSKTNYLDWSKKKLDLKLPASTFRMVSADPDDADNPDPIKLGPPNDHDYTVRLELPSKYTAHVPLPFSLKRDYGSYEATYKIDGNVFTAERKLVMNVSELPSARVQDYLSFRHAVMSDLAQQLSLETTVTGTPSSTPDVKAGDLNRQGNEAIENGDYAQAIELLQRAVEKDPKHRSAWNNLGRAYLETHKYTEAITAFNRQIEINPYDEHSYNNLGRAYWQERKYEDAVTAFRKQIEVNPLDHYAYTNLGRMYNEWHKYDEAHIELEKAASLTPKSAEVQVSLGEAYLNLGQDDKATAAFERALEISATPRIWNDIAYRLARKGAHLDRAQQYAESAVTTTVAALRNLSIDQIDKKDLGLVSAVASYWDTLGWVHFAKGDLAVAEKYVAAAWALRQGSDAGDHLGQIYEKRGDKAAAERTYALVLNTRRPEPETRGRLAALLGSDAKVDAAVAKSHDDLLQLRTITGTNWSAGLKPDAKPADAATASGIADFFVLLTGGRSATTAEGVKFVSGDERLQPLSDALRKAKYTVVLPDDTPLKILRRGTLTCPPKTENCTFEMALPEDVRSVE
jgi:Flp pilus assembly protein TadD